LEVLSPLAAGAAAAKGLGVRVLGKRGASGNQARLAQKSRVAAVSIIPRNTRIAAVTPGIRIFMFGTSHRLSFAMMLPNYG
jgi:hypothetical protein